MCDLPRGGWTAEYMWNGSAGQSHTGPICVPFPRHPREAVSFLNPVPPVGVGGNLTTAAKSQSSSAGLAVRVCGSPGLDGRVYTSELYPPPHRLDDGDTDCDVADASVFDFSSVTTCSPDETLNRLRGAEARDDEDDDEEDSEVQFSSNLHTLTTLQPCRQGEDYACRGRFPDGLLFLLRFALGGKEKHVPQNHTESPPVPLGRFGNRLTHRFETSHEN